LSVRGYVRFGVLAASLVSFSTGTSCYRAEVDLAPLVDDESPAGGGVVMGLGGGASGGASGGVDGGAAGAATCDPTPEDAIQQQCRLRMPSTQSCDEQYIVGGWNGCYNGGCSVCTKVLIDYPHYFERHPCCQPNITCSTHEPYRCSPLCPPPTELDKRPVCFDLEL
jgi:hypothetical protein